MQNFISVQIFFELEPFELVYLSVCHIIICWIKINLKKVSQDLKRPIFESVQKRVVSYLNSMRKIFLKFG